MYTYRTVKGTPLSHAEFDANWEYTEDLWTDTEAAKDAALAGTNFQGKWDVQTGAATVPYSVLHNGSVWSLISDIPDVTLSEPSDSNPNWHKPLNSVSITNVLLAFTGAAANAKAFVDAAGTAVEWGPGFKVLSFTRDMTAASGDVAYTGIGFKPSYIILFMANTALANFSLGIDDGTNHLSTQVYPSSSVPWSTYTLVSVDGAHSQLAVVNSMDTDGFTLTWTKNGTPSANTIEIFGLAVR